MGTMSKEEVRIRQEIVNNISDKVKYIEAHRAKRNRKPHQKDVEAIKGIARDIAEGKLQNSSSIQHLEDVGGGRKAAAHTFCVL